MTTQCERETCFEIAWSPVHEKRGPWSSRTRTPRPKCLVPKERVAPSNEVEFRALSRQWKRETAILSNLSKIVMHPAYQRIMAMGPNVIPLILQELNERPGHWFWALHNLVPAGSNPAEGVKTTKDARNAWLEWGKTNHLLG